MKEFMKGGDIYLNKTQSMMLLAGVILIALLSFLLGFLTNQTDKSSLTDIKNKDAYKEVSSQVVSKEKVDMNLPEPLEDEKNVIKETELTFYKTLANSSPETKNIPQKENISPSKKIETVDNLNSQAKIPKKQERVVETVQKVPAAVDEEKDEAVEVDSKFGHLNVPNNKKTVETGAGTGVETGLRPVSTVIPTTITPEKIKPTEKKAASNLYTIQVASFTSKDDAFKLKNKLEKKGFDSYIMLFIKDEVKWFRVRVGSLNTKDEAAGISKKIKDDIKLNPFITRYER